MKKLIFIFTLVTSYGGLEAGTIRDGGDKPIKQAEWICKSLEKTPKLVVRLAWRKPEVQLQTKNVNIVYEKGLREVFRSSFQYSKAINSIYSEDLGLTDSTIHFFDGKMDLALSIYHEQERAKNVYRARISYIISNTTYSAIELKCIHTPPSDRPDYVDSIK